MLRLISPFLVQYSVLQISAAAGAATAAPWACAADARPDSIPAPIPTPAALRMVRRASAGSFDGLWVMAFSIDLSVGLIVTIALRSESSQRSSAKNLSPRMI